MMLNGIVLVWLLVNVGRIRVLYTIYVAPFTLTILRQNLKCSTLFRFYKIQTARSFEATNFHQMLRIQCRL